MPECYVGSLCRAQLGTWRTQATRSKSTSRVLVDRYASICTSVWQGPAAVVEIYRYCYLPAMYSPVLLYSTSLVLQPLYVPPAHWHGHFKHSLVRIRSSWLELNEMTNQRKQRNVRVILIVSIVSHTSKSSYLLTVKSFLIQMSHPAARLVRLCAECGHLFDIHSHTWVMF